MDTFPLNPSSNKESPSPGFELPVDVWFHIASFIPFSMFRQYKLYTVNRELLEFYLREKPKFVEIFFTCDFFKTSSREILEEYISDLNENNSRAYITKSLVISFRQHKLRYTANEIPAEAYSIYLKHKERLLDYFAEVMTERAWRAWKREALKNFSPLENMSAIVSQMQNLTSVKLDLRCWNWNQPILPFEETTSVVCAAWTASQASLTSLELMFALASFPPLCLDNVFFPNLQKFSLMIAPLSTLPGQFQHNIESFDRAKEPLLKFFLRHRHQIVDFAFMFPSSQCLADLLNGMTFSRLKNLFLVFAMRYDAPILGPLASFLSRNSANVEELVLKLSIDKNILVQLAGTDVTWWLPDPDAIKWWIAQPIFHVPFPNLKSLSLICPALPNLSTIYPIRLTAPLDTLHVCGIMPYNSVVVMLRNFTMHPIGQTLKCLQFNTEAFSPMLLRILADGLPRLKTLYLSHEGVGHDNNPQQTVTTLLPVYESIASVDLSNWGLQCLELFDRLDAKCPQTEAFREAVVKILPSVTSFNGVNQSDYIRFGGRTSRSLSSDFLFTQR